METLPAALGSTYSPRWGSPTPPLLLFHHHHLHHHSHHQQASCPLGRPYTVSKPSPLLLSHSACDLSDCRKRFNSSRISIGSWWRMPRNPAAISLNSYSDLASLTPIWSASFSPHPLQSETEQLDMEATARDPDRKLSRGMAPRDKALTWLRSCSTSPPFTATASFHHHPRFQTSTAARTRRA